MCGGSWGGGDGAGTGGARKEKIAKSNLPKELDGRDGPEPTRYNDWEKNGITSDF